MAITVNGMLGDISTISTSFSNNVFIQDAKKSIRDELSNAEISEEERSRLYAVYVEQISVAVLAQAIDLAKAVPLLNREEEKLVAEKLLINAQVTKVKEEKLLINAQITKVNAEKLLINAQKTKTDSEKLLINTQKNKVVGEVSKIKYEALTFLASLHKQYGYPSATLSGLGGTGGNGLIDEQIKGFKKDMAYKAVKTFSEQAAMLAQNDVATPAWMTTAMKSGVRIMTENAISV